MELATQLNDSMVSIAVAIEIVFLILAGITTVIFGARFGTRVFCVGLFVPSTLLGYAIVSSDVSMAAKILHAGIFGFIGLLSLWWFVAGVPRPKRGKGLSGSPGQDKEEKGCR